ncbi:MAG: NmrA family NAD(P)-binding protein [Gemmatimonadetes bacterium]|nr:NmrA family NAD(P)-binding protein [Gemmatimonadota bacterium]
MEILVIGGTGTVGTHAVRGLVERGESPKVMTREPGKAGVDGAEYVEGGLGDGDAIRAALEGVEAVLLITPLHPQEGDLGVAAVKAMDDAGIERLVFQSIHRVQEIPDPPHFASKIRIEEEIVSTGIPHTVIAPNNFFQNDLWLREPIVEHGVYSQPFGNTGLSRVDARDVADAHVRALLDLPAEGLAYPIVGPDVWTAEETAEAWGRHLDREVIYGGDDLDAYAEQAGRMMPGWLVEDLVEMYAAFQERGLVASEEELSLSRAVVDHAPRTFDDFAAETAARWSS